MVSKFWLVGGLAIDIVLFVNVAEATASETFTKISFVEVANLKTAAAIPQFLAATEQNYAISILSENCCSRLPAIESSTIEAVTLLALENELFSLSPLPATKIPQAWKFNELNIYTNGNIKENFKLETESESKLVTQEATEPKTRNWSFSFTPYFVVPLELSGDSSIAEVSADLDVGLGDIIGALDFALFGQFEAFYRDRLGFYFNGYYTNLSSDSFETASGSGLSDLGISIEAKAENQQAYFDLGFTYRFDLDDNAPSLQIRRQKGDTFLDLTGGMRIQYLNQTIDLDISGNDPLLESLGIDRENRLGSDNTWVEPLLRTRFGYAFNEKLALFTAGEVSGFGIGDWSLSWRTSAGIDWIFAGDTSFIGGYTVSGFDYESGSGREQFGLDAIQHGPFFAFRFRF
ncbi:hypothetical protein [Myxosarcina sp. GI1]|uniref:hypothetical protein n=1 Tax=Myxosarcina sp. GI1 TaxID=1541065 RepID=UPI00055C8FC2|nr:hypothetical protein [Myxosarcina sp. GI1]